MGDVTIKVEKEVAKDSEMEISGEEKIILLHALTDALGTHFTMENVDEEEKELLVDLAETIA